MTYDLDMIDSRHGTKCLSIRGEKMKKIDGLLRLLLVFALAFLSQPQSKVISQSGEETSSNIYLPFVGGVSPLQVTGTMWTKSKYDAYWSIAGNLLNVSARPIYDAVVQASVTWDGQPYGVYTRTVDLPVTFPGQYNSFYIMTDIYNLYFLDYEVELISWSTSSAVAYWPLSIVYSDTIYYYCMGCDDYTIVNAELRNDSPRALTDVYVEAWRLGGNYLYGSIYYPPDPLLPGDTFTFTAKLWWTEPQQIKMVGYGVAAP
jgi:hypothetical protein